MVVLTGNSLTLEEIRKVCYENEIVQIDHESLKKVAESRKAVEKIVKERKTIYGINTGFGKFSDVIIAEEDVNDLQLHLIRSHACGVGSPFPETVSRTMVLLRLNALLKGFSGVRVEIVERLVELLNYQIHPVIPQQGSLGASGDLAPLSHLALVLVGEGMVHYKGEICSTQSAYKDVGLTPIILKAKEGLALINGTQAMTAMGVINWLEASNLAIYSEWVAALTMESLEGIIDAFHPAIHEARGYSQQIEVAKRIRKILNGSQLITRQGEKRVQDAYSLRCIPQVHGASLQAFDYVKEKLEIEINAATDNPLIFDGGNTVISGGNFHGQPIAIAMDFMKIAICEFASISERRIERLVNPQLNDLPPFLSTQPGLQSGAMIMQYCAASLVSENKTLAHPASGTHFFCQSRGPCKDGGTIAARHAYMIIQNVRRVLAIECICALQAVEYRGIEKLSRLTRTFYEEARKVVPTITQDRVFSTDIEKMTEWLLNCPPKRI